MRNKSWRIDIISWSLYSWQLYRLGNSSISTQLPCLWRQWCISKFPRSGPRQLTPLLRAEWSCLLVHGNVHAKTTCREVFGSLSCKRLLTGLSDQEVHFLTKSPCHLSGSSSPFPYPPHDRRSNASAAVLQYVNTQRRGRSSSFGRHCQHLCTCRVCAGRYALMCHEEICTACAYTYIPSHVCCSYSIPVACSYNSLGRFFLVDKNHK
jgi:hypothetical protein